LLPKADVSCTALRAALAQLAQLCFRLLQSVMPISRYIAIAVVLLSLLGISRAAMQFAEAQVAVGDGWTHATRLGECQCLAVVDLAAFCIEAIGMGRDLAEQMLRMGPVPRLA